MTAPTFGQIKAQVAAIQRKIPGARVIGIRATGRWTGKRLNQDGEKTYVIEQCDSPLAMRLALREFGESSATLILVTDLDDRELGDDILVRLTRRRLFPINSWQIVQSLFQAHAIDPRLTRHRWIADFLMESVPGEGYPAVAGGFLDAETVWPILLRRMMGLNTERPDLLAILRWSTGIQEVERYRSSPPEFREAALAWLSETAGPAVSDVFRCIEANPKADALPIGLALAVVFSPEAKGRLDRAAGKMEERFLGRNLPTESSIARWSEASNEVIRLQTTDERVKTALLQRSDEILREVDAETFAFLSATSPIGFNQRLARFGEKLSQILQSKRYDATAPLIESRASIGDHELARRERRRLERADMAIRLVRWLQQNERYPSGAESLVEAAREHVSDGGFADWARLTLRPGDPVRELSEAYGKLFDQVAEVREAQARQFAELLRDWTEANSESPELIPIERILETFLVPLAAHGPVLLIVVDGMSIAVARELLGDLVGYDWVPLARQDFPSAISAGLATIPSVTEASRSSLLQGELSRGTSDAERVGFASHPALRGKSRGGHPPLLFHKPLLQDQRDAVLSAEVRKEIASMNRRVIGVVVNAVDDHLLKGEQVDMRWSRDSIPVLSALLHEARAARRIVVVTSDHGHILDARTEYLAHEGGERWRLAAGQPEPFECRVAGPRVLIPESKSLIAPWSERVRYGAKRNGYHGGLSPQEMIVPIAVLSPTDSVPDGWTELGFDQPTWWEEERPSLIPPEVPPSRPKAAKPGQTALLFDLEEHPESSSVPEPLAWVEELLRSPIFEEQKKLAGRAVPSDEIFRKLLVALENRGGKLTFQALALALNYPAIRLRGLLAIAQRVFNIDGYAVLARDDASDTVELNRELLHRQFDLS